MGRRNPETVIVAVLLAASGVLLGLFVGSWFVLFVFVLMLGLLIMLRPAGAGHERPTRATQTSSQDDDAR